VAGSAAQNRTACARTAPRAATSITSGGANTNAASARRSGTISAVKCASATTPITATAVASNRSHRPRPAKPGTVAPRAIPVVAARPRASSRSPGLASPMPRPSAMTTEPTATPSAATSSANRDRRTDRPIEKPSTSRPTAIQHSCGGGASSPEARIRRAGQAPNAKASKPPNHSAPNRPGASGRRADRGSDSGAPTCIPGTIARPGRTSSPTMFATVSSNRPSSNWPWANWPSANRLYASRPTSRAAPASRPAR